MQKVKIIEIKGGLGNQMFQYALYEKLKSIGYQAMLDDTEICKSGNQHNGLELLNAFSVSYNKISKRQRIEYWVWKFHDKILKIFSFNNLDKFILYDKEPTPFELVLKDNVRYLKGYWQSPSYWNDIREKLLQIFSFKLDDIDEVIMRLSEKIQSENSVALHIRRGDYLWPGNAEKRMGICTVEYYLQAIQYIENSIDDSIFYVYTDDPEWVNENFKNIKYTLIDKNRGKNSYLDMYLMSVSKHNIIANSTFSWWAAWLNRNPDKIVICPARWYNSTESKLIMDDWIKI